jgi:hypothetical protein
LADGTFREHHYARPQPEAPAARPETLAQAIAEYQATPEYRKNLAPRTRKLYAGYLEQIRTRIGSVALRSITPAMIQRVRIDLQDTPSKANMWLAMLSIVLSHCHRMEYIATNPAVRPGRLPQAKRDQIWSVEEEERVSASFRRSLNLSLMLLLYTLQRPSDMLAMTTTQVTERDGRLYIQLRQQKTKTLVAVPVHARLEPLLRARLAERVTCRRRGPDGRVSETESLLLVPSPTGLTWSRRNWSRAWDHDLVLANLRLARELLRAGMTKDAVRAELAARHRQRRDFRRTGIVRLAEAGATTPQIAAISGHSIDYCQKIIDTYLPRRTEVALGGLEVWERAGNAPSKVVRLNARRGS